MPEVSWLNIFYLSVFTLFLGFIAFLLPILFILPIIGIVATVRMIWAMITGDYSPYRFSCKNCKYYFNETTSIPDGMGAGGR